MFYPLNAKYQNIPTLIKSALLQLCLFTLVLISYSFEASASDHIALTSESTDIYVASHTSYLEDKTQQLTLKQLLSPTSHFRFKKNTSPQLDFGYSNSAWWVHFSVISHSENSAWYLLIDSMLGADLDIYIFPAGTTKKHLLEETKTYTRKIQDYRRPAWNFNLPQNQPMDIYIRATNGQKKVSLPIQILDTDSFLKKSTRDYVLYTGIYATLLALAFYQLIIYSGLREKSYLILGMHTIVITIALHAYNPVLSSLNFLENTNSHWLYLPMLLAISTALWVYKEILDTHKYSHQINKIYTFSIVAILALIPLTGFTGIYSGKVMMWIGTIYFALILITSIIISRKGNKIATYVVLLQCVSIVLQIPNWWQIILPTNEWFPQRNLSLAISNLLTLLGIAWIQAKRVRFIYEKLQSEEAVNKAKDNFLATMSHELRTPLHGITNLGTLLSLEKLTNKQKQYVEHLNTAAQHQLQLINNLLDFAKFSKNQAVTDRQAFQLDVMLDTVVTLSKRQAEEKNLEFIYQLENLPTAALIGDRLKLSQVLLNLLNNAVKYTDHGYIKLHITTKPLQNHSFQITFNIKDTGQGITKEKLETIFNPFVQINAEKSEGIGLGLALCKKLVLAMGGKLEVQSEAGEYSHFFFTLELPAKELSTIQIQDENSPTKSRLPIGLRILLTDDSEINRFIGKEMLINMGADVELAHDGEQAILTLQNNSFDIVLMDINMPGVDGIEASQWVRKHAYNPKVPIIALTADALSEAQQICIDAGMDYFLRKPFDYDSLYAAINQLLAKQAKTTPILTNKQNNVL